MTQEAKSLTHRHIDLGEVRLHIAEAGEGPLVLLLHGFPEMWYSWRHQIQDLAEHGFHVVAPDLRGTNLSDKPPNSRRYGLDTLAGDVAALITMLGEERAAVVGHDWGAAVGWWFAMRHPDRLTRLGILNVPHPERFWRSLRSFRQLRRSWYIFFFQLPWLPEYILTKNDHAALRHILQNDPLRPDAMTPQDIEKYVAAANRSGGLRGGINFYRALLRRNPVKLIRRVRRIDAPVIVIWGERDRYLGTDLAEPSPELVPHCRVERVPDASHFVQLDCPERVNELLVDFLSEEMRSSQRQYG